MIKFLFTFSSADLCVIDVVRREKNIEQSEKPESFLVICNFAFQHIWEYRQFGDNFLAKEKSPICCFDMIIILLIMHCALLLLFNFYNNT